jgi:hypothetical protein
MTEPDPMVFRFDNQLKPMTEAMINAGHALRMGPARKASTIVVSLCAGFLMAAGGAVVVVLALVLLDLRVENTLLPALVGAGLGIAFFFTWYNGLIRIMATSVLEAS